MSVPFDKIVDKIVGLGVPGLVLLVVMSTMGFAGAVALTSALALLGGPLGMLGGVAVLGVLLLISQGLTQYGFEKICVAVLSRMHEDGKTKKEILVAIDGYWFISEDLKRKLHDVVEKWFPGEEPPPIGSAVAH